MAELLEGADRLTGLSEWWSMAGQGKGELEASTERT